MPMWSNTDAYLSKPTFPLERFQHGTIYIVANNTPSGTNVIILPQGSTTNIVNGMIVTVASNVAATNVAAASIGELNFNVLGAPTVTNKSSNTVTISTTLNGNIGSGLANQSSGLKLAFTKPIANLSPNVSASWYNANTILVTTGRIANTSHNANVSVAHTGWNVMKVGTGGRAGRVQSETLVALSNPRALDANSGNTVGYNYFWRT